MISLLSSDMASLNINDIEGSDDQDTLAPLASLAGGSSQIGWINMPQPMAGGSQVGQIYPQIPPPSYTQLQQQGFLLQPHDMQYSQYAQFLVQQHGMQMVPQAQSVSSGSGSHRSGSQKSSHQIEVDKETVRSSGSSERSAASSRHEKVDDKDRVSLRDDISVSGSEMGRDIGSVPSSISGSRQSFRIAMVNPLNEFFVDVM